MLILCGKNEQQVEHWSLGLGELGEPIKAVSSLDDLNRVVNGFNPELVLVDLEADGCDAASVIRFVQQRSNLKFFVFSALHQPQEGVQYISAGARGYANRLIHPEVLTQAAKVVISGEMWLGADLILHLIQANAAAAPQPVVVQEKQESEYLQDLTAREREIANLVAQGNSNKQVASELGVSERTIKAHMGSIFKKTNTKDRLQLALLINS